jgi:hypothetical protein
MIHGIFVIAIQSANSFIDSYVIKKGYYNLVGKLS